jgi:putative ABC transport system permease protein
MALRAWRDLLHGARFLRRNRSFSLVAILSLALVIGANTAVFSAAYAVLLKPLPYPQASALVSVRTRPADWPPGQSSPYLSKPLLDDLSHGELDFAALGRSVDSTFTLTGDSTPEVLSGSAVSGDWFDVYGVRPLLGRSVDRSDSAGHGAQVVVLSYGLWQRAFGANPTVVGQAIELTSQPTASFVPYALASKRYVVIGVMPPRARFPADGDLWVPLPDEYGVIMGADPRAVRDARLTARLRPDRSLSTTNAHLHAYAVHVGALFPKTDGGADLSAVTLRDALGETRRAEYLLLLGAAGFVLLASCIGVGGLVAARNRARRAEIAIRTALGATPARLAAQFTAEALLLTLTAGSLGVLLAWTCLGGLRALAPGDTPRLDQIRVDPHVLGFALVIVVASALAIALAPVSRLRVRRRIYPSTRHRRVLIATQIALLLPMVVGAVLTFRSLDRLSHAALGYAPDHLLVASLRLSRGTCGKVEGCLVTFSDVLARVRTLPQVSAGALCNSRPLDLSFNSSLTLDGFPTPGFVVVRLVSPDYFRVLGVPLRRGRLFSDNDGPHAPLVAIANESLAHALSGRGVIGRHVTPVINHKRSVEIVGEVADTRDAMTANTLPAVLYLPFDQMTVVLRPTLLVRTTADPKAIVPSLRAALAAIDPDAPSFDIATMDELLDRRVANPRFVTVLLGAFAAMGLVLAIVGTYGVVGYVVAERGREFGVRLALGATPSTLVRLVLGEALVAVSGGVGVGLALSVWLSRYLRSAVFEISAPDIFTFVAVGAAVAVTGLVAYGLPARRVGRLDPAVALRHE